MYIYYCLFIVMLMPILLALGAIPFRLKQFAHPDINAPREQAEQLTGVGARIVSAQKNAWEGLILFSVSLFIAVENNVAVDDISLACTIYVIARILHAGFYLANLGILRFISFLVAFVCIVTIALTAFF